MTMDQATRKVFGDYFESKGIAGQRAEFEKMFDEGNWEEMSKVENLPDRWKIQPYTDVMKLMKAIGELQKSSQDEREKEVKRVKAEYAEKLAKQKAKAGGATESSAYKPLRMDAVILKGQSVIEAAKKYDADHADAVLAMKEVVSLYNCKQYCKRSICMYNCHNCEFASHICYNCVLSVFSGGLRLAVIQLDKAPTS